MGFRHEQQVRRGQWAGAHITVPAMSLGGDRDPVVNWFDLAILDELMATAVKR
ncbi:hypothetical protein GCM10009828_001790 [Actinoplanes couchii]|uniref:Uncharacterized protein n=1 Tax=Actinoplanes couchii TaxID=403638 RepID=A0ABQ3XSY9_9ACTN|nr:hypothetical protein Aco03nite_100370 [Actinoplanes couchii]